MGSLSDFGEQLFLSLLCTAAITPSATVYVAFATADPTDAATGAAMSEVPDTNNYSRTAITFGAAAARRVTQSGIVTFPQATGPLGTVTHWALVDSPTWGAGNVLGSGAFSPTFAPVNGNAVSLASGQLYIEIAATGAGSDGFTDYYVHGFLNRLFRNQAFTKPATYVGLTTAIIDDQDGANTDLTEVTTNNCSRVLVNSTGGGSPAWEAVSGGHCQNANTITMPTPSGSWSLVTSSFLIDSASGAGNVLGYINSQTDQTPVANDSVFFPAGAWGLTCA